jgi:hypothetical protein
MLLGGVAGGTAGLGRGMMRQAGVTIAAILVPLALADCADLGCMATIAKAAIGLG